MHNPWKDSVQCWVLHRRISDAQPQFHFRNQPEHKQKHLQEEQQAPRKNEILKPNTLMLSSSCLSERCALVYPKEDGHYFIPEETIEKANENEE